MPSDELSDREFALRINDRFPEGLTAVFAIGATRRTYILEQNRQSENPGQIGDFSAMTDYLIPRYFKLVKMFFDLGGQNLLITILSFRSFFERGADYVAHATPQLLRLTDAAACDFYHAEGIDPYFVGIDTLLMHPSTLPFRHVIEQLAVFQKGWDCQPGHRKLLWEVASIPLYTFWQAFESMTPEERHMLGQDIQSAPGLSEVFQRLYARFSRLAYGTEFPGPHLYVGANMSGDIKWASPMPIALTGGDYIRMYYTPYPTLFMTPETLRAILNDVLGKRVQAFSKDYKDNYSRDVVEAEYQRALRLSGDPSSVVGYTRYPTA
ncbi:MAG TPA: hypothetical protein VMT34_12755 [Aggregatilineales bacterium]|nr:hypothetical protein [Aggregatilineales bacterium]